MFGFVVRRVVSGLTVMLMVTAAAFVLFFMGPSDPARQICGDRNCTPQRLADIRASLNLDEPLPAQFTGYMTGIFTGRDIHAGAIVKECPAPCLGYSYLSDRPVTQMIAERLPVTISVAGGAVVVFLLLGVTAGAFAAIHRGKPMDKLLVGGSLVITSFPYYIVALLAALFLSIKYPIFPRGGYTPLTENPLAWVKGLLLAWVVLGLFYSTQYARYTRAAMVEALGEDFVRTARAKGLPPNRVHFKHALRAGLTSVVTIFGLDLAGLLAGTIFTERIFDVHGLGLLALDSFNQGDLPVIMGTVLYAAFLLITLNIIIDIVYSFLDPRVRLG